jgi:hypothetical protein
MRIAKIKSEVLSKALQDRENFWTLSVYLDEYNRTEDGCFVTEVVKDTDGWTTNLRLSLGDYLFNEAGQEAEKLWDLAEKLIGKKTIDFKCINIVTI